MVVSVDAYAVLVKNKAIKMISSVIECVITLKNRTRFTHAYYCQTTSEVLPTFLLVKDMKTIIFGSKLIQW